MTDWQPIEIAPKDGTDILIWSKEAGWHAIVKWWRKKSGPQWVCSFTHKRHLCTPSHWMPLPPPPTESFAAGETPAQAPGQEERPLRASSLPSSSGSVSRKADAGGANIHPSSDVGELVGRLRDEGDKMDARFGTRLCDEAAAMLQRQEWVINAMKRESDDWERAYKKLEAKFWEVRDAGIKAEDALERYWEALVRIAQDQTSNDLNETNLVRINIARAALEEPKP